MSVQVFPSPVKPVLQTQTGEPEDSSQVALDEQPACWQASDCKRSEPARSVEARSGGSGGKLPTQADKNRTTERAFIFTPTARGQEVQIKSGATVSHVLKYWVNAGAADSWRSYLAAHSRGTTRSQALK